MGHGFIRISSNLFNLHDYITSEETYFCDQSNQTPAFLQNKGSSLLRTVKLRSNPINISTVFVFIASYNSLNFSYGSTNYNRIASRHKLNTNVLPRQYKRSQQPGIDRSLQWWQLFNRRPVDTRNALDNRVLGLTNKSHK